MNTHRFKHLLLVLSILGLATCGEDLKKKKSSAEAGSEEVVVSGWVVKGPVNAATVDIYSVDTLGNADQLLESTVSSEDGGFSLSLGTLPPQAFIVKSSGGSYIDEATRTLTDLPLDQPLATVLTNGESLSSVAITPLTSMAAKILPQLMTEDANVSVDDAAKKATQQVAAAFDLSNVDLNHVIPRDLVSNPVAVAVVGGTDIKKLVSNAAIIRYSLALSSLSQYVKDQGQEPGTIRNLVETLASTISDSSHSFFQQRLGSIDTFVARHQLSAQVTAVATAAAFGRSPTPARSTAAPVPVAVAATVGSSVKSSTSTKEIAPPAAVVIDPASAITWATLSHSSPVFNLLTGGQQRSLTITNTSYTYTAHDVVAVLPSGWSDLIQDASNCSSILPRSNCVLTFTSSGRFAEHPATTISIAGSNTDTLISSFSTNFVWGMYSSSGDTVSAQVTDPVREKVYVGGSFYKIGPNVGRLAAFSTVDGSTRGNFLPQVSPVQIVSGDNTTKNVYVDTVVSDGNGGMYIGGRFNDVDGLETKILAHIYANGRADPNFKYNIIGGNVYALKISGTRLYFGGDFTSIDGVTYNKLAAIDLTSGAVITSFNPNVSSTVRALTVTADAATLYVGGDFTTVGGSSRSNLAAINTSNGALIAGFPSASPSARVRALLLTPDNSTLYVGGEFTTIGGSTRNRVAALNTTTGVATSAFNPNLSAAVYAMALSPNGATLYLGGLFDTVGGLTFNRLVAVNTSNGAVLTGFVNPGLSVASADQVNSIVYSLDGAIVYVGGDINTVNGVSNHYLTKMNNLVALDAATGATISSFAPSVEVSPNSSTYTVRTLMLSADGTSIYAGGNFPVANMTVLQKIVAMDMTSGHPDTTFAPPAFTGSVTALALSPDRRILYIAGSLTAIAGGGSNNAIIAVNAISGELISSFTLHTFAAGSAWIKALAASPDGKTLYLGGTFATIDGVTYNNLAALNTADGTVISSFNPNINNTVYALTLSADGSTLYLGGAFTLVGGASYPRVAAVNTVTGTAVSEFNPNVGDNLVYAMQLTSDGARLYLGGTFTLVGGATYNKVAAVSTVNGTAMSSFNPNITTTSTVAGRALALSPNGDALYIGGGLYTAINGVTTANRIAAVNPTTGVVLPNTPEVGYGTVTTLVFSPDGKTLFLGGDYNMGSINKMNASSWGAIFR